MRFVKPIKDFGIGRFKVKRKPVEPAPKPASVARDSDLTAQLNSLKNIVKEATSELNADPQKIVLPNIDDVPIRPHGPIGELIVGPEEEKDEILEVDNGPAPLPPAEKPVAAAATPGQPPIAAPQPAPPPPAADKKDEAAGNLEDLNKLFNTEENEENPLSALINSLPDVTAREIIDDLEEIKMIMEGFKKKK